MRFFLFIKYIQNTNYLFINIKNITFTKNYIKKIKLKTS